MHIYSLNTLLLVIKKNNYFIIIIKSVFSNFKEISEYGFALWYTTLLILEQKSSLGWIYKLSLPVTSATFSTEITSQTLSWCVCVHTAITLQQTFEVSKAGVLKTIFVCDRNIWFFEKSCDPLNVKISHKRIYTVYNCKFAPKFLRIWLPLILLQSFKQTGWLYLLCILLL